MTRADPITSTSLVGGLPVDPHARSQRNLLVALLACLLLWNLPYGWVALYPFKILSTWLHESSHALVMLLAGAGVARFDIYRDTSGLATPAGGVTVLGQALVSSAGYMGTALFGATCLVVGQTARAARALLVTVGLLIGLTVLLWVRTRFAAGVLGGCAACLLVAGLLTRRQAAAFIVNFIAAQACVLAILDIRVLFAATVYVDGKPYAQSDASIVAGILGGPRWLWAALWLVWSLGLFYLALRSLRRRRSPARVTGSR